MKKIAIQLLFLMELVIIFLGCSRHNNDKNKGEFVHDTSITVIDASLTIKRDALVEYKECSSDNILLLKQDGKLFRSFFEQIESWKNEHELASIDDSIFAEISMPLLENFLGALDVAKLRAGEEFVKEYEFNKSPMVYKSDRACVDKIRLSFDKQNCQYKLFVENNFYVDEDNFGCSEHEVYYLFKITDGKIELISMAPIG